MMFNLILAIVSWKTLANGPISLLYRDFILLIGTWTAAAYMVSEDWVCCVSG